MRRVSAVGDNYEINGGIAAAQRQLGNAVPAALAEVVARKMRRNLLGDEVDLRPTLIPQRQEPVPEPEQPAPVHPRYLDLAGEHEAHPGTGKGYAAERREERPVGGSDARVPRLPLSAAPRSS